MAEQTMETKALYPRNRISLGSRLVGLLALIAASMPFILAIDAASAATESNVRRTKHNLSKTAPTTNTVKSTTEDQVCVFCHTPHAATAGLNPLWNRQTSGSTYTKYGYNTAYPSNEESESLDATLSNPNGNSVLCLSCHDGQVALGNVNVLNGTANAQISVNGSTTTKMPAGASGDTSGFTRKLGTDLRNDHPISFTYDDSLAATDGELQRLTTTAPVQRDTGTSGTLIGIRESGYTPKLPLQSTGASGAGQVQCGTCHDPHLYDSADSGRKFLRLNRLQKNAKPTGTFSQTNDIICLACHTKLGTEWANSAHADNNIADEAYHNSAADLREFPQGTKVWEAACLNCHDTHTVTGARRLLREGNDQANTGYNAKTTGVSAIEETCYQCHNAASPVSGPSNALNSLPAITATAGVPDIKNEFARSIRMPIVTGAQGIVGSYNTIEKHNISNADFEESTTNLGSTSTANRHVECTDCHNPHRVIRNELFNGTGSNGYRTHIAGGSSGSTSAATDGNLASGVLRGIWGVEVSYGSLSTRWPDNNMTFNVKKGQTSSGTAVGSSYLTREYQLCFKCHSDYGNPATFPLLGRSGGTVSTTNSMTNYTDIAAEMAYSATDPPTTGTDQGEYEESTVANDDGVTWNPTPSYPGDTDPGASMTDDASGVQNHRSWHPVRMPTGRTLDERRISADPSTGSFNFLAPFKAKVGTQTMYCSDCHGNLGSWTKDSGPTRTVAQGPHGSANNFLLKGPWSTSVTIPSNGASVNGSNGVCLNCHYPQAWNCDGNREPTYYCWGNGIQSDNGTTRTTTSGFNNPGTNNQGGHGNAHSGKACMRCHVAVPHGWKNKAFLVNLNCVGSEGGQASECVTVSGAGISNTNAVTMAPYYISSYLRVAVWRASGNWREASCGVAAGGLKSAGKDWMTDGGIC